MRPARYIIAAVAAAALLAGPVTVLGQASTVSPHDKDIHASDSTAIALINVLLESLKIEDEFERLEALRGVLHASNFTDELAAILPGVEAAYAHALERVEDYEYPARIERATKERRQIVGVGKTAETAYVRTFFLARKEGLEGPPRFVKVSWPTDGDSPSVLQMGL